MGLGAANEVGLDREPASTDDVDLSKVGHEAKDDLDGPPKDAA